MRNVNKLCCLSFCIFSVVSGCAPINNQVSDNQGDLVQRTENTSAYEKMEGVRGDLVPQRNHMGEVMAVDYASSHDFFVTGSKDSTLKVWRPDGQLIRTIDVDMWVFGLKIFGNDKYVMAHSNLGDVKVIDIETGSVLRVSSNNGFINDLSVSRDGNIFAVSNNKGQVIVRGINGKYIATFNMPAIFPTKQKKNKNTQTNANNVIVTDNGALVIASNMYGEIVIWEIDGKLIRHVKVADAVITSLDIYDSKLLVTLGYPYALIKDYSKVSTEAMIVDLSKDQNNSTIFKTPMIDKAIFADHGNKVYALSRGNKSKNISVFNIKGELLREFKVSSDKSGAHGLASSQNGAKIVTVDNRADPTRINLWTADGERILRIQKPLESLTEVALNKEDMIIAASSYERHVKLWSIHGKYLGSLNVGSPVQSVDFMNDGQRLVVGALKDIQIWDYKKRKLIQSFKSQKNGVNDISIAPNNQWFVAVGGDGKVQKFSSNGNKYIADSEIKIGDKHHNAIEIAPDSNGFIAAVKHKGMVFYDISGKVKWIGGSTPGNSGNNKAIGLGNYCGLDFSDSKDKIAALNVNELVIFDINGHVLEKIPVGSRHHNQCDVKFINQDKQIIITVPSGIALWDLEAKTIAATYKGHSDTVTSLVYMPDTTLMISGSRDGDIRLWNLRTGYSAGVAMENKEWIIYDHYGYFDASSNGGKIINFSKGMNTFSVDQFALYFNRPDIIYSQLGLANQEYLDHLYEQYKRRIAKAFVNEKMMSPDMDVPYVNLISKERQGDHVMLRLSINDTSSGLKSFQIYNNNVPLFGKSGKQINGESVFIEERIALVSGDNSLEISAINNNGGESYRISTVEKLEETKESNLFFVGLGVSKYKLSQFDLEFAAKDVVDLSRVIPEKYKNYKSIHTKLYLDDKVTRNSLSEIKQFLSQATVHDTVIMFISGHGVYERSKLAEYYYITHDAEPGRLEETAISWTLIEEVLYQVKANKKLMLMDTCESGEMDVANQLRAFDVAKRKGFYSRANQILGDLKNAKRERRQFLYFKDRYIYNDLMKGSGTYVFSSSAGGEMSYESKELKNGFFTRALLDAMGDDSVKVDKDKNRVITIEELVEYVSFKVSGQTGGLQNPTVDRGNPKQDFLFRL